MGLNSTTAQSPRTESSWHPLFPGVLLRIEAALLLALSLYLYFQLGGPWLLLVLLFLAPDIGALGYLAGPRVGAAVYNLFHSYPAPALLALGGLAAHAPTVLLVALVWFAHIEFDRLVGYGLKFPDAFKHTHLGRLGR